MAGESVVGALRVVLGMDTGAFEDGAKRAANKVGDFGTQMKAVFAGVGLERIVERTFDFLVHSFKDGVAHAIEFADQTGKTAQKVGVSVEQLSALRVAATLSDVSMESLSNGLGKLSKNMVDAAGGTKEAKDKFDALGISVRDSTGQLKSPVQVLAELADKFEHSADGAGKTATALNLLGKGGKDLIPLLNEGGNSLREFADVAERMGLIVGKQTAEQSQKLNDNLKILKLASEGLTNQVVAQLLPALVNLSGQFADTAKKGDLTRAAANYIVDAITKFTVATAEAVVTVQFLGEAFVKLYNAVAKGGSNVDETQSAFQNLLGVLKAVDQATSIYGNNTGFELPSDQAAELARRLTDVRNQIRELLKTPVDLHVNKAPLETVDKIANGLKERLVDLGIKARDLNGEFLNLAPGFVEAARGLKLIDENGKGLKETLSLSTKAAQDLNFAMQNVRAAQITQENLSPWDAYIQKMTSLQATFNATNMSQQVFAQQSLKNAADLATAYGMAAQAIVSPMAQAFKTLSEMNKTYAGIAKAAAIGEALVNTYLAATKALASVPPPFNFAAAAAVTAAGLVNVAKISATQFQQGGRFTVGGVGGIDSQLVQFKATPGEMVDVRKPGQTTGPATEVTVNLRGRDLLSRDMIRDLFNALNEGVRDGYRVKLAEA